MTALFRRFKGSVDIAGGFEHFAGLRAGVTFVLKSVGLQATNHHGTSGSAELSFMLAKFIPKVENTYTLTNDGKILSVHNPHKTKDGIETTKLEEITDIAVNIANLKSLSPIKRRIFLK